MIHCPPVARVTFLKHESHLTALPDDPRCLAQTLGTKIQLPSRACGALWARTSASFSSLSMLPHRRLLFLPHASPFFLLLLFSDTGKCRLAPSCRPASFGLKCHLSKDFPEWPYSYCLPPTSSIILPFCFLDSIFQPLKSSFFICLFLVSSLSHKNDGSKSRDHFCPPFPESRTVNGTYLLNEHLN